MDRSPVLVGLKARVQQTQRYMTSVRNLLPPSMSANVEPGPVNENTWCVFAKNSATASKLKHLLPELETRIKSDWGEDITVRVKVLRT